MQIDDDENEKQLEEEEKEKQEEMVSAPQRLDEDGVTRVEQRRRRYRR